MSNREAPWTSSQSPQQDKPNAMGQMEFFGIQLKVGIESSENNAFGHRSPKVSSLTDRCHLECRRRGTPPPIADFAGHRTILANSSPENTDKGFSKNTRSKHHGFSTILPNIWLLYMIHERYEIFQREDVVDHRLEASANTCLELVELASWCPCRTISESCRENRETEIEFDIRRWCPAGH